ncbi:replication initiator protein [Capybara microvirus Cap1_SP_133]|nr:replication initiator protein [Capybara microvirus Cap1_SP_133]
MACYHPLRLFRSNELNEDTGKPYTMVLCHNDPFATKEDFEQRSIPNHFTKGAVVRAYEEIPCGTCIGCRIDYAKRWTARCVAESYLHDQSWFVTLTYDDDHLPADKLLHKEDLQDFIKKIRRSKKCRYFACGEYGDSFGRPHYHLILFGLALDDARPYCKRGSSTAFTSRWLSKLWNKGFIMIENFDPGCAEYVARYVLKKRGSWNEPTPPFLLMSRKPGIGYEWFAKQGIKEGRYVLPKGDGTFIICGLPHYLRVKEGLELGNAHQLRERDLAQMSVSGFKNLDDFRSHREFISKNPARV